MSSYAEATELIEYYLDKWGEVPMLMDVKSLRKWEQEMRRKHKEKE